MKGGIRMPTISYLCKDDKLINRLKDIDGFSGHLIFSDLANRINTEICLISDKEVGVKRLIENRHKSLIDVITVFYLVSMDNYHLKLKEDLIQKGIIMIPPRLTENQIVERVCANSLNGLMIPKNIVVFYGIDGKVGVSQIAQSVATRLAKHSDCKVFLGHFNERNSMDYMKISSREHSLDRLRVKINNKVATKKELLDICVKRDNLYMMGGANSILERRYYHPRHVEYILDKLSQEFDILLIDAGSNIEQGLTFGALNSTNIRYLVATQNSIAIKYYEKLHEEVLKQWGITQPMVIINKYLIDSGLYTSTNIAKLCNGKLLCELPYLEWGLLAEKEERCLVHTEDNDFKTGIDDIITDIALQANLEYTPSDKDIGFLERLFKGFSSKVKGAI